MSTDRPEPSLRGSTWSFWPDESPEAFEEAKASLPVLDGSDGAAVRLSSAEQACEVFGDCTWLRWPFADGADSVSVSVIGGKTCYTAITFLHELHWHVRAYYPPPRAA
mgnify:CR=1 FL=1